MSAPETLGECTKMLKTSGIKHIYPSNREALQHCLMDRR